MIINIVNQTKQMESRKGWTSIEDDRLLKVIKKYGIKNWTLVADKLATGTTFERTGKQCRQRWHNHLNPSIVNKEWSARDDERLFEAHRRYGSKWKEISKLFEGRTDNAIKNHFYSTVRRSLRKLGKMGGRDRFGTITMKSIKPSVLSKIVENTELAGMIVGALSGKGREETELNETSLLKIESELNNMGRQHSERSGELMSNTPKSNLSLEPQEPDSPLSMHDFSEVEEPGPGLKPEEQMREFDESENFAVSREEMGIETHHDSKEYSSFPFQCEVKEELKPEAIPEDDEWEYEGFFKSPAGSGRMLPSLRLLNKVSRASHSSGAEAGPGESLRQEYIPVCRPFQERLQIHFNYEEELQKEQPEHLQKEGDE